MSIFETASPAPLAKTARLFGTNRLDYIEIDVILTHLLQRMSEEGVMDHLIFKGGTMLRKMVFGPGGRLSTDLDFVVRSADAIKSDDLALMIASVFLEPYRGIRFELGANDVGTTEGSCRANPKCITTFTPGGHHIKIEVSYRADPVLPPVMLHQIKQQYFEDLGFEPASVPCLQLEEAIGEKVRAAFQRPKIRDLHDLQQLRQHRFDPDLVRRMAVLKLWESPEGRSYEPFSYDTFVRRMNERVNRRAYDENDLQGLLRKAQRVDLQTMVKEVAETYSFLKQLTPEESVLAEDQYEKARDVYESHREAIRADVAVPASRTI